MVAALAIGAGLTMRNANAAPVSPSALEPSILDTSMTEDVQWRRCWHRWRSSRIVCRWHGRCHYWRGGGGTTGAGRAAGNSSHCCSSNGTTAAGLETRPAVSIVVYGARRPWRLVCDHFGFGRLFAKVLQAGRRILRIRRRPESDPIGRPWAALIDAPRICSMGVNRCVSAVCTRPAVANFATLATSESLKFPRSFNIAPHRSKKILRRSGFSPAAASMTILS